MRVLIAAFTAATLLATSALAADVSATGPLEPGKPAGVKAAQAGSSTILWVIGGGLVIGGIILLATSNDDNTTAAPVTSGTSP